MLLRHSMAQLSRELRALKKKFKNQVSLHDRGDEVTMNSTTTASFKSAHPQGALYSASFLHNTANSQQKARGRSHERLFSLAERSSAALCFK